MVRHEHDAEGRLILSKVVGYSLISYTFSAELSAQVTPTMCLEGLFRSAEVCPTIAERRQELRFH
jgi:hypothetical protein